MASGRAAARARIGLAVLVGVAGACSVVAATTAAPRAGGSQSGWHAVGASELARTEVTAARVGSSIYVVGGFGPGAVPSAEVERFEPVHGDWEVIKPLPVTLNHAGAVGHRGDLYVFGGFEDVPLADTGRTSARMFRYRPETGDWTELAPLPVPRAAFAAGVIGNRLYVAGGSTATEATTTRLDVYDFRRDRWRSGPPMAVPREHVAGAVAGRPGSRRLYVLGGRDFYGSENYRTVERFDPRRDRWGRLPDMGVGHGGFAAAGVGRRVVAVGGERPGAGATGTIAATEVYSPRRRAWLSLPDMLTPRHGLGVAALGRTVYALEGGPITLIAVSNAAEAIELPRRRRDAGD